MTFRELQIGATFDFIGGETTSFFSRCTKVSPRCYTFQRGKGGTLRSKVGNVDVEVFHVEEA